MQGLWPKGLWYLPLLAVGIVFTPDVSRAQQRPLSTEDIAELVRGEVAPGEILNIARPRCVSFRIDSTAETALRSAGADNQLIQGLRSVCYRPVGYSTTRAAVSSLLLPGSGQFYTRRPLAGFLSLSAFGGALAFGLLSQSTTIECLGVATDDRCDGPVLSTTKERPYLLAGVGAAAAVAAISAMDAARGASRANERISRVAIVQDRGVVHEHRIRLEVPAVLPGRDGVAFEFIRLRF
jgi:TM2 domain-containing membrane protein YozV